MTHSTLLTFKDMRDDYRLPRSTIYHLLKTTDFPKQIKIGSSSYFKRVEIDAWLEKQTADTAKAVAV